MTLSASAGFAPEYLVREVLMEGLAWLAAEPVELGELFKRFDVSLANGSAKDEAQADAMRARLRALVRWGSAEAVQVTVGYPAPDAQLPCLGIVTESDGEQVAGAVVADTWAATHSVVGTGDTDEDPTSWERVRVEQTAVRQVDQSTRIQVSVWATSPEESQLLAEAVRLVFLSDKGRLRRAGVLDVSTSMTGFAPDERMKPRVGYVPVLAVTLDWSLSSIERRRVPSRILGTLTFST